METILRLMHQNIHFLNVIQFRKVGIIGFRTRQDNTFQTVWLPITFNSAIKRQITIDAENSIEFLR